MSAAEKLSTAGSEWFAGRRRGDVRADQRGVGGTGDWTFGLADTKRRLGVCKYRTKRIEIAEYYLV